MTSKDDDLISVCIPTYNQENFISKALEGVLMQKDCNYEIIIADDGSTDQTKRICEKYYDKFPDKITLINQNKNIGLIQNTKDCLYAAKGNYIAICEGDDYWIDEYKLSKQLAVIKENPDVTMVHSNWINMYQESCGKEKKQMGGQRIYVKISMVSLQLKKLYFPAIVV